MDKYFFLWFSVSLCVLVYFTKFLILLGTYNLVFNQNRLKLYIFSLSILSVSERYNTYQWMPFFSKIPDSITIYPTSLTTCPVSTSNYPTSVTNCLILVRNCSPSVLNYLEGHDFLIVVNLE